MYELVLFIIGGLFLFVASLMDIKTTEVSDLLSYGFIVIALVLNSIRSFVSHDWMILLWSFLVFGMTWLIGLALYYSKQWGGADAKLLMGVGALFGGMMGSDFLVTLQIPLFISFFLNLLIVGAMYGLLWSIWLMCKHWNNFRKALSHFSFRLYVFLTGFVFLACLLLFFLPWYFSLSLLFFWVLVSLFLYLHIVEKSCLIVKKSVKKLQEGDWILQNIKTHGKVIARVTVHGLSLDDIIRIKKSSLKMIVVKEGIPFIPSFFIAYIVTLTVGNVFLLLL